MSVQTKLSDSLSRSDITEYKYNDTSEPIKGRLIKHLINEINEMNFEKMFNGILNDNEYLPSQLLKLCIDLSLLLSLQNKTKECDSAFLNSSIMKFKDEYYKISKTELLYIVVKCDMIFNRENSVDKLNLFL